MVIGEIRRGGGVVNDHLHPLPCSQLRKMERGGGNGSRKHHCLGLKPTDLPSLPHRIPQLSEIHCQREPFSLLCWEKCLLRWVKFK